MYSIIYEHLYAYQVHVLPVSFQGTRKQEWTAIIPNSQLIVIPFPHNQPRRYINTLVIDIIQYTYIVFSLFTDV